jgi:hypothetical protein
MTCSLTFRRSSGARFGVWLLVLALAGCSGEDQDQVEGTGYVYAVPDGWQEEDGGDLPVRPDSLVVGDAEDGFATNVNVIREARVPRNVTAAQYAEVSLAGLRDPAAVGYPPEVAEMIESLNPRGITEPRDAELDGEQAVEWEYRSTQDGRDLRVRQVAAVTGGAGYTVTLTVLPDGFEEGSEALDEVVESWSWE